MTLARWLALALATTALGCSDEKPPETPSNPPAEAPPGLPEGEGVQAETKTIALPPPKVTVTGVPAGPGAGTEDYIVNEHDCDELGKAYGAVTRTDLESQMSPKLSDKQRAATEKSIRAAAAKMEIQAGNQCRASLVGNVADQAALRCAMAAKTAKAYDACLNAPGSPPASKK